MPAPPMASGASLVGLQVGLLPLRLAGACSYGPQYSQQRLLLSLGVPPGGQSWLSGQAAVRLGEWQPFRAGVLSKRRG